MPTRSLFGAPTVMYRIPRAPSSAMWPQTLTPDRFLALSPPQVSYPSSPGRGTVWNVHTSLPVVASHARVSPAGPEPPLDPPGPSPVPASVMIRFLKIVGDERCEYGTFMPVCITSGVLVLTMPLSPNQSFGRPVAASIE